jgi:hypothetical protein
MACVDSLPAINRTDTEGGKMANILFESRRCMAAEALAKARAFSSIGRPVCKVTKNLQPAPALPSMLLEAKSCNKYQGPTTCVPESIRIANIQQKTIEASKDSTNPNARFAQYVRNFPVPCPPIPAFYINAGEPILQGKRCALPNKPDNPVLPG